jgi:hypothetical protein
MAVLSGQGQDVQAAWGGRGRLARRMVERWALEVSAA